MTDSSPSARPDDGPNLGKIDHFLSHSHVWGSPQEIIDTAVTHLRNVLALARRQAAEEKHYRTVLNRIADTVGHPRIAAREMGVESIAARVEGVIRQNHHLSEINESLDPAGSSQMRAVAASLEHHEEHHEREKELEDEISRQAAEIERLQRDLEFARQLTRIVAEP